MMNDEMRSKVTALQRAALADPWHTAGKTPPTVFLGDRTIAALSLNR
jgi:hypothetical protein